MRLELTPNDIIYTFTPPSKNSRERVGITPEYEEVYNKIKTSLSIMEQGYNVFLIDSYSKDRIEHIENFIKDIYKSKNPPMDISLVVKEDEKSPKVLYLKNGNGVKLKRAVEEIQNNYGELAYKFYNGYNDEDKDKLLENMQRKRTELITNLVENAKREGFDVKVTSSGFAFTPLKEGEEMSEKEYDELDMNAKNDMISRVSVLRSKAQEILEELKDIEIETIDKIKEIMKKYIKSERVKIEDLITEIKEDKEAMEYIDYLCDSIEKMIIDNYTASYQEDEEGINEIILKYNVNALVNNENEQHPLVIYEEDPTVANLLGSTEYENHNGNYVTDMTLIQAGSIIKANEGCIIMRASNLLSSASAYNNLKKVLLTGKVKLDYNRNYLELLSVSGLKPETIKVNTKVVLIGDYETYDLLYNYDEDFKNIFKVRAEFNPTVENNEDNRAILINNIVSIVYNHGLKSLTDDAIKEVAKYLSRKANNRKKFYLDENELTSLLILANNKANLKKMNLIESKDIIETAYTRELIERETLDYYRENKILLKLDEEISGSVTGLSVIDEGYFSFGKPIRITCTCYKGEGNIIDVQKESNLSGNIHSKSINILKGYINRLLGGYNSIPVDFHISFEQLYGKIEGDSASVAEVIVMLSALSKVPVKQGIAVTGSINQFGEVQPIGGVNEKIEGFYNVCKLKGNLKGKGVLIPYSNKNEIILNPEVENAIKNGEFKIYAMSTVEDAIEVLMANEKYSVGEIQNIINKEIKKYINKK